MHQQKYFFHAAKELLENFSFKLFHLRFFIFHIFIKIKQHRLFLNSAHLVLTSSPHWQKYILHRPPLHQCTRSPWRNYIRPSFGTNTNGPTLAPVCASQPWCLYTWFSCRQCIPRGNPGMSNLRTDAASPWGSLL